MGGRNTTTALTENSSARGKGRWADRNWRHRRVTKRRVTSGVFGIKYLNEAPVSFSCYTTTAVGRPRRVR